MGCNFYDALLYGIECRGFIGTKFIEFLVGFPLLVGQLSAIALSSPTFCCWHCLHGFLYFFPCTGCFGP
jgi:hypothetical protein